MKHTSTDSKYNQAIWRKRIRIIIEGTNTPLGKLFDVLLLVTILLSVLVVMLDSITKLRLQYGNVFNALEWIFTILFTIEYGLRIYSARDRRKYIFSFFGVVDLISLVPTYLALVLLGFQFGFVGFQYLIALRILRIIRIFRILGLMPYLNQAGFLLNALYTSRYKITVFFIVVSVLVTIMGAVIYVVEGPANGFTSIPKSMYWAIVTLTTVGYGDISPKTPLGQAIASMIMITGYSIIAVPTGLFTAELSKNLRSNLNPTQCPHCGTVGHVINANFCAICGHRLDEGKNNQR